MSGHIEMCMHTTENNFYRKIWDEYYSKNKSTIDEMQELGCLETVIPSWVIVIEPYFSEKEFFAEQLLLIEKFVLFLPMEMFFKVPHIQETIDGKKRQLILIFAGFYTWKGE